MEIYNVPLEAIPSREFSFIVGEENILIKLSTRGGCLYLDLGVNNETIVSGLRCDANVDLLRGLHYKPIKGSFKFLTQNNNRPYYTDFNAGTSLYYVIQ